MLKKDFLSPIGELRIMAEEGKLIYCNWVENDCLKKELKIESQGSQEEKPEDMVLVDEAIKQLREYFEGTRKEFHLPLQLKGSNFQKKVWSCIGKIEFGQYASYKDLGIITGTKGYRAVASACGANPVAIIIPCHRIIGSQGRLGGYTGGIEKKEWLLKHEKNKLNILWKR